jgi:hypothetical protein
MYSENFSKLTLRPAFEIRHISILSINFPRVQQNQGNNLMTQTPSRTVMQAREELKVHHPAGRICKNQLGQIKQCLELLRNYLERKS